MTLVAQGLKYKPDPLGTRMEVSTSFNGEEFLLNYVGTDQFRLKADTKYRKPCISFSFYLKKHSLDIYSITNRRSCRNEGCVLCSVHFQFC